MSASLLAAVTMIVAAVTFQLGEPAAAQDEPELGERLFLQSCASCHGPSGRGTELGPSLQSSGAASAHFQLSTGRMPLADPEESPSRKEPAFADAEIDALVDYVASLGSGPPIPDVVPAAASLSAGGELFVANCAPCHGATGNGGAVGGGAFAPSLLAATPVQIAEAMITGPGEMPIFDFPDDERDAVVRYVGYLQTEPDPGGLDIGGVGPVPEGFVAWVVGTGALVLACAVLLSRKGSS